MVKSKFIVGLLILIIAFISGCVEEKTGEKASFNNAGYNGVLFIKEIGDIDNGTYFEITDDELKEHPEIIRSIRGGEGCTKSEYGGWYCELTDDEVVRFSDFFNRKHSKYLFSIGTKFRNNLNANITDAELMNTFKSNGFPLSENYSIFAISRFYSVPPSPYDMWFVNEKADTPEYSIYEINDELKVYKSGYTEYQFVKIGEHYYEIQLAVT